MKLPAILTSIAVLLPTTCLASAGENEWSVGLGTSFAPAGRLGLEAAWLRNLTDFWGAGIGVRDRRDLGNLPDGALSAAADVRLVVDALTWVPAVTLGAGVAMINDNHGLQASVLLRAEASLGWRPARDWGLVAHVGAEHYGGVDGDTFGIVGVGWIHYSGSGIGLDL